jgi:hypothetical protein
MVRRWRRGPHATPGFHDLDTPAPAPLTKRHSACISPTQPSDRAVPSALGLLHPCGSEKRDASSRLAP